MKNSPNALPWLLLGVPVFLAFKWELLGGLLVSGMGVFTVFFFNAYRSAFVLFAISVPLIVLGGILIFSRYYERDRK